MRAVMSVINAAGLFKREQNRKLSLIR